MVGAGVTGAAELPPQALIPKTINTLVRDEFMGRTLQHDLEPVCFRGADQYRTDDL